MTWALTGMDFSIDRLAVTKECTATHIINPATARQPNENRRIDLYLIRTCTGDAGKTSLPRQNVIPNMRIIDYS